MLEAGAADAAVPVLAFVPGWTMPASLWRAQLEALSGRWRVAALDPRGQGESEVALGGYDIDRRADDIAEFVVRYARVVLVGWSLAALEALQYLHRHGPGRLAGLVLVDSSVGQQPAPPENSAFREDLRRDRQATVEQFVRAMFRTPVSEAEIASLCRSALRMPVEASLSLFPGALLPREHWRDLVEAFPGPLLYAVTPRFAEQASKLQKRRPGTRIEVFENAGHALFVDEQERFNSVLGEFAESVMR